MMTPFQGSDSIIDRITGRCPVLMMMPFQGFAPKGALNALLFKFSG